MCNRYRTETTAEEIAKVFQLSLGFIAADFNGEYYPGRLAPVIVQPKGAERRLESMTWGFPNFKGPKPLNNTRSEGAPTSRFWKSHLNNRCVFPLSSAVEWKHVVDTATGEVRKVPHSIAFKDGRLGAIAGIFKRSEDAAQSSMMTCSANTYWSSIHNADPSDPRMICFLLDHASINAWLDPSRSHESVWDLLRATPDDVELIATPLAVNKPAKPSKPSKPAKDDKSGGLFG